MGGLSIAKPVISTFHSFCVRLLRRDIEALRIPSTVPGRPAIGHTKNFVIYDETDQQQVVKGVMRRLGIDDKQTTLRSVLAHISLVKNHMLDPQEVYLQSNDPKTERVAQIYEEYRKQLGKANALDFDDLLLESVRLLKARSEVRESYNQRFQYIMIDEYQDTNRPQYELMRLLAGTRHNVCAVGDEDQSIYSWRGADIRNILEFEKDFPEAQDCALGAELPFYAEYSAGCLGGGGEQYQAQGQESLDIAAGRSTRSATMKLPMGKTKPCSPPTTLPSICVRQRARMRLRARRSSTAPTRNRGCLKRPCDAIS